VKYKHLILFALLVPRLEFLNIPGVNSGIRFDVIALLLVSMIPLFVKVSKPSVMLILMVLIASLAQIMIFHVELPRMVVGLGLYVSIISFSQFSRILSLEDLVYICHRFLIINCCLHIFDMAVFTGDNHNFTGRYGVFNQHFAFASALVVSYFFLFINKRTDLLTSILFFGALILSGSRGLIVGVLISILLANFNILKNIKIYLMGLIIVPLFVLAMIYFFPENIHLKRLILTYDVLIYAADDIASILTDPAFSMRVSNMYAYFDHIGHISNSALYVIIGGGPYTFLDYSIQFGKPGHFDNLYFRVLSEYGLLALAIMSAIILYNIRNNYLLKWYIVAMLIGAVVSEAMVTLKVGHLFFLTLLFYRNNNEKYTQNYR